MKCMDCDFKYVNAGEHCQQCGQYYPNLSSGMNCPTANVRDMQQIHIILATTQAGISYPIASFLSAARAHDHRRDLENIPANEVIELGPFSGKREEFTFSVLPTELDVYPD